MCRLMALPLLDASHKRRPWLLVGCVDSAAPVGSRPGAAILINSGRAAGGRGTEVVSAGGSSRIISPPPHAIMPGTIPDLTAAAGLRTPRLSISYLPTRRAGGA